MSGALWDLDAPRITQPLLTAVELTLWQCGADRSHLVSFNEAHKLHGALHTALAVGHTSQSAAWSLSLPTPRDRRLWLVTPRADYLDRLPGEVTLFAAPEALNEFVPRARAFWTPAPHELRIGHRAVIRAPKHRAAGEYRVRVFTRTPLVMRKSLSSAERAAGLRDRPLLDRPTQLDGLLAHTASWLGLQTPDAAIAAEVTASDLERVYDEDDEEGVIVGGHWRTGERVGRISGLIGWMDVRCNAVGRWLLDCAERLGIGSRTTIGFGRVRVEDLQ